MVRHGSTCACLPRALGGRGAERHFGSTRLRSWESWLNRLRVMRPLGSIPPHVERSPPTTPGIAQNARPGVQKLCRLRVLVRTFGLVLEPERQRPSNGPACERRQRRPRGTPLPEQRLPRASQRRTALGDGRLPVGSLEHVEVAAHHGQCLIRGGADQAGRGHDRNADSGDGCQATAARWPRPRLCPNVLTANAD